MKTHSHGSCGDRAKGASTENPSRLALFAMDTGKHLVGMVNALILQVHRLPVHPCRSLTWERWMKRQQTIS
ncbi:hypothetical protein [Candidatus Nitrospira allomarina]|uniref:Uncharacterized protein n=1 Tax=Candidatus Nitrospira allomarina TaxID=3020900 RepID=A0AA96GCJ7_9BACT|nr:hypothetical protein [Candidatus Nitrospira allomarina]WNM57515.1 hypothetical protein PP769_16320 [Candidatus Nitrospira allomarina]